MHRFLLIAVTLSCVLEDVTSQTGPTHCTYSDGVFECDYDKMTSSQRPIDFAQFSVQPQRLIVNVNGLVPSLGDGRTFSTGFSTNGSMDVTQFDPNCPATLELDCGWGGSAYIDAGAFYDMEYIQHFKIKNCDVYYLGTDTVDGFQDLDYFRIEGGTIDLIDSLAMGGLTVEKLSSAAHQFPRNLGRFEVVNAKFVSGAVTPGLLYFFGNVTSVSLKNTGLIYLTSNLFRYNTFLRLVDLSDNLFTAFPSNFLVHQPGLSEIVAYNIDWQCSCDSFSWIEDAVSKNITVRGDGMCANMKGTSVFKYWYDNCADGDVCEGIAGMAMESKCVPVLGLFTICLGFLAFPTAIVALALAIINLRNLPEEPDEKISVSLETKRSIAIQRWKDATRKIIDLRRSGKPMNDLTSLGSDVAVTMSIPDETRSTDLTRSASRASRIQSIPDETRSAGLTKSASRASRIHSIGSNEYADFPSTSG